MTFRVKIIWLCFYFIFLQFSRVFTEGPNVLQNDGGCVYTSLACVDVFFKCAVTALRFWAADIRAEPGGHVQMMTVPSRGPSQTPVAAQMTKGCQWAQLLGCCSCFLSLNLNPLLSRFTSQQKLLKKEIATKSESVLTVNVVSWSSKFLRACYIGRESWVVLLAEPRWQCLHVLGCIEHKFLSLNFPLKYAIFKLNLSAQNLGVAH